MEANQIYASIQNWHCKQFIFEIIRYSKAGGHHMRSLVIWYNVYLIYVDIFDFSKLILYIFLSRTVDVAAEEPSEDTQKLITTADNNIKKDTSRQRKLRSATLLKKEQETPGKSGSRKLLAKVIIICKFNISVLNRKFCDNVVFITKYH